MNIVVIWYCKKKTSVAQVHRRVYMYDSLLLWIFSLIFTRSFNLMVLHFNLNWHVGPFFDEFLMSISAILIWFYSFGASIEPFSVMLILWRCLCGNQLWCLRCRVMFETCCTILFILTGTNNFWNQYISELTCENWKGMFYEYNDNG